MTLLEWENRSDSALVVGCTDTDPAELPPDLLQIAYVFSGADRILGFYGRLEAGRGGKLTLRNFLACCTRRRIAHGSTEASMLQRCLADCGWAPSREHGETVWHSDPYRIVLISEPCDEEYLFHAALSLGDGPQYLEEHLRRHVARHSGLLDTPRQCPPARSGHPVIPVAEAARLLRGRRLIVYTGAGISAASRIPTFFGRGSLDERLRLHEPFPGEVVALMCAQPGSLARELGAFQARLLSAAPNRAHAILAELEALGVVREIITTNLDLLHERAGSGAVSTPTQFLADDAGAAHDPEAALLVLGVSDDSEGAIARARAAGWSVVVGDIQPPGYLCPGDCYARADAETLLAAVLHLEQSSPPALFPPRDELAREPGSVSRTIPHLRHLLEHLMHRSTSSRSEVHGWRHWLETAQLGWELLRVMPDGDPAVVLLFALLHDSCRLSDHEDPDHGRRAAQSIPELQGSLILLTPQQERALTAACAAHADGWVSANATLAACWDADRLGLWRVGLQPDPDWLSLEISRSPERIAAARRVRSEALDWYELYERYQRL